MAKSKEEKQAEKERKAQIRAIGWELLFLTAMASSKKERWQVVIEKWDDWKQVLIEQAAAEY
jgi:hypothetical protein